MMDILLILLAIIGVVVVMLIVIYNRLVSLRQKRNSAFSDIDVQLKLRHDLVPNLVNTVKGYAGHESQVLEKVTDARARAMKGGSTSERAEAEGKLGGAMMELFAVAEAYPDLKANQNFMQLQTELADIENKIAAARRFFNNITSEYNTAIQQFPAVLIANSMGFTEEAFFDIPDDQRETLEQAPAVSFD